MSEFQVLKEGNPNCKHEYVNYMDVPFDGQAWWCDIPSCQRQERIAYGTTPETYGRGQTMKFPPNAYIRTPNPKFGGDEVYAFQADSDGVVKGELPLEQRILRKVLEDKVIVFTAAKVLG